MDNKNEEIRNIPVRKRVKVYRSEKGYNRTRDRKDKKLYEFDMEAEKNNGIVEESQGVLQSSKSSS